MKNNIDFIYEYSDLNLFQTRVQILTGKYTGIVLEFGSSVLEQWKDQNNFKFDYTLYLVPDTFFPANLKVSGEFNEFLAYLLVDIIDDRNNDIDAKEKLEATAIGDSIHKCNIKIDSHFYPLIESQEKMLNSKFISTGYQEF